MATRRPAAPASLALLAVLGLSFWFFLAFPWADHNESYSWRVQLERMGPLQALAQPLYPVATERPLGVFTAWLSYRLSGNSLYPQQLLNYAVAAAAWLLMLYAAREKRVFSLVALAAGGLFFSGYIYLFHLHGAFYSPALLYLALLFALQGHPLDARRWTLLAAATLVLALYHPFVLLMAVAFVPGALLEGRTALTRRQIAAAGAFLLGALALVALAAPRDGLALTRATLDGWLASYRTVELNAVLGAAALALALLAVEDIARRSWRARAAVTLLWLAAGLAVRAAGLPLLFVWIGACVLMALLRREWSLAALVTLTALLPAITATGSPTYTVFVLMACAGISARGNAALEARLAPLEGPAALAPAAAAVLLVVVLRAGINLPVVSSLVNPVLAEQEKTFQLAGAIDWLAASPYSADRLLLCEKAYDPSIATNALNRRTRPPTQQWHLDNYLLARLPGPALKERSALYVCFGDQRLESMHAMYVLPGRYNGAATVFEPVAP